ncbi:MAG: hypothetical protein SFY67_05025 [Candidatus Melainabacteria bacterium]|nr:hypothetical protein [Candidatus Melainabacteria bacterium]
MIPVNKSKVQVISDALKVKPDKDTGFNDLVLRGKRGDYDIALTVFKPFFPFGTGYLLSFPGAENAETSNDVSDPEALPPLKLTVLPRFAKGPMSILGRLFLFESKGQPVEDGKFERRFITSYNEKELMLAYFNAPMVKKTIWDLSMKEEFNELVINSDTGIYLYQPQSFNYLAVEKCESTFEAMEKLANSLTEVFYE